MSDLKEERRAQALAVSGRNALPDDAMAQAQASGTLHRIFQGYTTDPSDVLIGFGASASGHLPQGYVQNEVVLGRYAERVAAGEPATAKGYALTPDDRLRAEIIDRIMCDFSVDLAQVCRAHGASVGQVVSSPFRSSGRSRETA